MTSKKKDITELLSFNRRNFIKLAVGGAVGAGLSPLPWKLADDSAIFSQNFPWVPVPETGEFNTVKSHCTLCPGGCGIEVRRVEDRPIKIEGRTDHPVNPGGICPVGAGGLQLVYNENIRFKGPMKRIGARGAGKFEPITWEEALKELAGKMLELRNSGKADKIAAVDGNRTGSTASLMIERLLTSFGSSCYMKMPCEEDTAAEVSELVYGSKTPVTYDLENSDYILSFGCGLLEGWGSPGRLLNAWGIWNSTENKDRVTITQVESRASNTASKADKWLAARPGTETALALGIACVIITEGLYNSEFIDNKTAGIKEFKELVLAEYTPDKVSEITGIKAEDIKSVARAYAKAKSPVAVCGKGKGLLNGDVSEYAAVQALNALTGSINRPGGVLVNNPLPLSPLPGLKLDSIAEKSLKKSIFDDQSAKCSNARFATLTKKILADENIVEILLVFAANPAYTLPDGGDFNQSLTKLPYTVSFSPYMDETALMADLILPDHTYLEKMDDVPAPSSIQYNFYGITQPAMKPLYDTKNSGDVLIELAGMLGGTVGASFPWKGYEEVLKTRARGIFESGKGTTLFDTSASPWDMIKNNTKVTPAYTDFNSMWVTLKNGGMWYNPTSNIMQDDKLFATKSGRFEFNCSCLTPAKQHREKSEDSHSLTLMPYEIINLSSGWIPTPPYLYKTIFASQLLKNDSFIEINPETAEKHELKEGDRVTVSSEKGSVEARVHIFEGAMPEFVFMPMGFGHTAFDDFVKGKGCNPNSLIDGCNDTAWWNTPVRIN